MRRLLLACLALLGTLCVALASGVGLLSAYQRGTPPGFPPALFFASALAASASALWFVAECRRIDADD